VDEPKHHFPRPPALNAHKSVHVPRLRIKAARKRGSRQPRFPPLPWAVEGEARGGAVPLEGGKEAYPLPSSTASAERRPRLSTILVASSW